MILPDAIAADCNLRIRLIERLEIGRLKPRSSTDYMLRERRPNTVLRIASPTDVPQSRQNMKAV